MAIEAERLQTATPCRWRTGQTLVGLSNDAYLHRKFGPRNFDPVQKMPVNFFRFIWWRQRADFVANSRGSRPSVALGKTTFAPLFQITKNVLKRMTVIGVKWRAHVQIRGRLYSIQVLEQMLQENSKGWELWENGQICNARLQYQPINLFSSVLAETVSFPTLP